MDDPNADLRPNANTLLKILVPCGTKIGAHKHAKIRTAGLVLFRTRNCLDFQNHTGSENFAKIGTAEVVRGSQNHNVVFVQ